MKIIILMKILIIKMTLKNNKKKIKMKSQIQKS